MKAARPLPLPLEVRICSQLALDVAVQLPTKLTTSVSVPPAGPSSKEPVPRAGSWVTVICWPSSVMWATRLLLPVFAPKEKWTTPFEIEPMVNQLWSLLGAKTRGQWRGRQHGQQGVGTRRRPFTGPAGQVRPRQFLDSGVIAIGDVDVARAVHCHALGGV